MVLQQRKQDRGLERLQPEQYNTTVPDDIKSIEASVPSTTISRCSLAETTPPAPFPPFPIDARSGVQPRPRRANPIYQSERQWRREIMLQLRKRRMEKKVIQKVIQIWDLESGITAHTPEVFDAVERLLGIDDINWPEDCDREAIIAIIIEYQLEQVLRTYNYCDFTWTSVDGKGRLEMRPLPGHAPLDLPSWLQIPFLVPLNIQPLDILSEKARPSLSPGIVRPYPTAIFPKALIQRGDRLFQPDFHNTDGQISKFDVERYIGTLGVIMKASSATKSSHVVLTAGHVIGDMNNRMYVLSPHNGPILRLEVPKSFQRSDGRPAGRKESDEPCTYEDECAFLKIDDKDLEQFDHVIPLLDCHYFNPKKHQRKAGDALDPLTALRWVYIKAKILERQQQGGRMEVYKLGATTGLTRGYLVKIRDCPPKGWFELDGDKQQEWLEDKEHDVCLGIVQWVDTDTSFADRGDSGSLVYALEDGKMIPLGIHLGAPESIQGHSVFLSIDTFCYEAADREGWELIFTHSRKLFST